jgi:Flp pilus assembly protein TadG
MEHNCRGESREVLSTFVKSTKRGQSLVEMALVMPLLVLILAMAYTGWDATQQAIGLATAARAGAIMAENDLRHGQSQAQALTDATSAINAEEGGGSVYSSGGGCTTNCVTLATSTGTRFGSQLQLVTITVTHRVAPDIPVLSGITVVGHATGAYGV